jgi:hypothetical protein
METLYSRCCGLDVHKSCAPQIFVCAELWIVSHSLSSRVSQRSLSARNRP